MKIKPLAIIYENLIYTLLLSTSLWIIWKRKLWNLGHRKDAIYLISGHREVRWHHGAFYWMKCEAPGQGQWRPHYMTWNQKKSKAASETHQCGGKMCDTWKPLDKGQYMQNCMTTVKAFRDMSVHEKCIYSKVFRDRSVPTKCTTRESIEAGQYRQMREWTSCLC